MEKVLNDRELLLLQFVREALWRKEALPKAMDADELQALMVLARQHAVPALVADAVVRNGLVTNDDCTLAMVAVCMKHRKKTKMVTEHLLAVTSVLEQAQVPYVIFKGQVMAALYPEAWMRSTGDVDFYVPASDFQRAVQLLRSQLRVSIDEDKLDKHYTFTFQTTRFEMHYRVETFGCEKHQQRFDALIDGSMINHPVAIKIGEKGYISVLEPVADMVVVFKHLFNHLLVEGVGLRQVCDFALMLYKYHGHYDTKVLEQRLREIGYLRAFRAMLALAVHYLGLQEASLPWPLNHNDARWGTRLMKEIMQSGNFGRKRRQHRKEGRAKSLETAWYAMRHCVAFLPLAPRDIAGLVPKRIGITLSKYTRKKT